MLETLLSEISPFVCNALRQAGYRLQREALDKFSRNIGASVSVYRLRQGDIASTRQAHDALRRLWKSLEAEDAAIGVIRIRASSLPEPAKAWIQTRAARLWDHLVGGKFSNGAFDLWVKSAEGPELVSVLKTLICEGGAMIRGRDDRPAKLQFEPMIMGVIRGMGEGFGKGGRPSLSARDELVMHLAIDWTQATGQQPLRMRRDSEGFSGLVHRIFDVLEVVDVQAPDEVPDHNGAEQALRRYWAAVENRGYTPLRKK